jgi:hypothetical protein
MCLFLLLVLLPLLLLLLRSIPKLMLLFLLPLVMQRLEACATPFSKRSMRALFRPPPTPGSAD